MGTLSSDLSRSDRDLGVLALDLDRGLVVVDRGGDVGGVGAAGGDGLVGLIGPPDVDVLAVPLDGGAESILEVGVLAPAQALELGAVDAVVEVVVGTVGDPDQALLEVGAGVEAEQLEHADGNLEVGHTEGRADVVGLAVDTLVEDGVEPVGSVGAVQVAALVETVALEGEGLVLGEKLEEAGDDFCMWEVSYLIGATDLVPTGLLTLGVLARSVDVVAADNDHGDAEGLGVSVDVHLGSGLGGRVGVGGQELRGLVDEVVGGFTVDLICADMDEASDAAVLADAVQESLGADHVVDSEAGRVKEGVLHVGVGGKVHHTVDVVFGQGLGHDFTVGQVALDEVEVGEGLQAVDVGHRGDIVQTVEADDVVLRVLDGHVTSDPAADEAGTTGDEDVVDVATRGEPGSTDEPLALLVGGGLESSGNSLLDELNGLRGRALGRGELSDLQRQSLGLHFD